MIIQVRFLLLFLWMYITFQGIKCFTDYSIDSFKMMNETSDSPFSNCTVKLKRTKNTYPKVFWEGDLVDDLRKYELEFRMSYSSAGNDLYRLLPYRIYRQPVCDVLNTVYRHSLMEDAKLYSNGPYSKDGNVNLCDLTTMGHYYFRNYSISPSIFPSSLQEGRYRLELFIYKKNDNEIVNGLLCTQTVM